MTFPDDDPSRIDPPGCRCGGCMFGPARPLQAATREDIRRLVAGAVEDATSAELEFTLTVTARHADGSRTFTYRLARDQAEAAFHRRRP